MTERLSNELVKIEKEFNPKKMFKKNNNPTKSDWKKLFEHLTTKKEEVVLEKTLHTNNENLLQAVLVNNFNVLYNNNLTEEQKQTLKDILSMPGDVIEKKTVELKESLNEKIDTLISESSDSDIKDKLSKVKQEVNSKKPSRINYHSLVELKNGLD
jgi:hypothetical protein